MYAFIRQMLGDSVSDREVARRWGVDWKSFVALKHGRRQVPRIDELERLAGVLGIDASHVFQVAAGLPALEMAKVLSRQNRLRAMLDEVTDGVFTVDPRGRIQDVNRSFAALLKLEPDLLFGTPLVDFAVSDSAPRLMAALATAARDGETRRAEVTFRNSEGASRVVEMDISRLAAADGGLIGAQGIARDVTEERRLAREVEEQRRLISSIYEHLPAAYILFASDGTILAANALVQSVCSATATEMIGKNIADIFGEAEPASCPVTRCFLTGRTEQQVGLARNKAGRQLYVHRIAGPITQQGKVEKVIEMIVDVTDQVNRGDLRIVALLSPQPTPSGAKRRAFPRAATAFPIRWSHQGRTSDASATSLGAGGLFVETADVLSEDDEVDLQWSLPGDGVPVKATAVVAWTRREGRPTGFGVRFIDVVPAFPTLTKRRAS